MANRPEVLSTKNTFPKTPIQFAACRNVGQALSLRFRLSIPGGAFRPDRHFYIPQKVSPIRAITVRGCKKCVPLKVERKL